MGYYENLDVPKLEDLQDYTVGDKLTMLALGKVPDGQGGLEDSAVVNLLEQVGNAADSLGVYVVNFTKGEATTARLPITCDRSYADIREAYDSGKRVLGVLGNEIYALTGFARTALPE